MLLFLVFSMLYGAGASVMLAQNTAENVPPSQIRGTVLDLLGRPIEGTMVKFLVDAATVAFSETRANGKFTLSEVPSGSGEIQIEFVGFKKYRESLYLNPGQKMMFVAGLEPGRKVEGLRVLLDQQETYGVDLRLGRKIIYSCETRLKDPGTHNRRFVISTTEKYFGTHKVQSSNFNLRSARLAPSEVKLQTLGRKTSFEYIDPSQG